MWTKPLLWHWLPSDVYKANIRHLPLISPCSHTIPLTSLHHTLPSSHPHSHNSGWGSEGEQFLSCASCSDSPSSSRPHPPLRYLPECTSGRLGTAKNKQQVSPCKWPRGRWSKARSGPQCLPLVRWSSCHCGLHGSVHQLHPAGKVCSSPW